MINDRAAAIASGIGDNSAKIVDGAAGIADIAAYVIPCKTVVNGGWSNSVPGRQIPEGRATSPLLPVGSNLALVHY